VEGQNVRRVMAPAENKVFIAVGSSGIEAYISQEVCLDIL
jgi:hypothetical protein